MFRRGSRVCLLRYSWRRLLWPVARCHTNQRVGPIAVLGASSRLVSSRLQWHFICRHNKFYYSRQGTRTKVCRMTYKT